MVRTVGGCGLSSTTGAFYIDMAAAPNVMATSAFGPPARQLESTIPFDKMKFMPWSPWGENNLLPQQMVIDIESCGILSGIIDGKARFSLCEGMVPAICKVDTTGKKVIERIIDDAEIVDFLEMNNHFYQTFAWMKDQCGIGNGVARFMLDNDFSKIVLFQRDDVTEVRYQKQDEKTGKINNLYYSAQWDKVFNEKDNRIFTVPLLDPNNPLADLQQKAKSKIAEHSMTFRYPGWGKHYYSVPLWFAAYKWVKIAQGVPEMKAALFQNTMRIKYMVIIYEQYWDDAYDDWQDIDDKTREDRRNELYDEIDRWLSGAKNAHKSIYVDGKISLDGKPIPFIEIKPIEDTTKQGEYLPDSAAANSEIAFAMLFNPSIIGASLPSGPYTNSQGGSNVRESVLMQIIIHEFERKSVQRVMNVIKYFNGWNITYPGIEFIIPATIMTTLDTGAGSKPVVTGGYQQNNNNNGNNTNSGGS